VRSTLNEGINVITINLIEEKPDQRFSYLLQVGGGTMCIAATTAACVLVYLFNLGRLEDLETKKRTIEARIERLDLQTKQVQDLEAKKKKLTEMTTVLTQIKARKFLPARVVDEIEKALPPEMWLVAAGESSGKLDLTGFALDEQVVSKFMIALEESKFITGVELLFTEQEEVDDVELKEFSLSARLVGFSDPPKTEAPEAGTSKGKTKPLKAEKA
jgi:Tfp pilus assembly protein PilN